MIGRIRAMRIEIGAGISLIDAAMTAIGHSPAEAAIISDHLMDCELRGLGYAGLARAVTISEYIRRGNLQRCPIEITRETPVSAQINGNGNVGYLVGRRATDLAIEKASAQGIAVVGASKTYYTGMYSYYLEKVTQAGLVGIVAGSGPSLVAPFGGTQPRLCTNPVAFGFPTGDVPIIWDIGTGIVTHAEVVLAKRLGTPLPEGIAFDNTGQPTTSAAATLDGGALTNWGGAKGFGLSLSVQLLAMMVGQTNDHDWTAYPMDCGFFLTAIDPALFGPRDAFEAMAADYARLIGATSPVDAARPVRVPFARSYQQREARRASGHIDVPDAVVEMLRSQQAGVI